MTAPSASRAVVVARVLGRSNGLWLALSVVIFAAIFVLVGVGFSFAGDVEVSVWDFASYGPKYYLLSVGAVMTWLALRLHVRNGVTRRDFSVGAMIFVTAVAVGGAVVMALGYQVERLVYDAAGWTQALSIPHLYRSPLQAHLVILEFTLVFLAHLSSGWLISTGFARLGWKGIFIVPPGLVPAVAVDVALQAGWIGQVLEQVGLHLEPLPLVVGIAVLVIAASWGAIYLAVRRMPVSAR